jgi:hypothetical protein
VSDNDWTTTQGKVVVSVNRIGMACDEASKRTGLNRANSSTTTKFFIYHGGTWRLELWSGDLLLI